MTFQPPSSQQYQFGQFGQNSPQINQGANRPGVGQAPSPLMGQFGGQQNGQPPQYFQQFLNQQAQQWGGGQLGRDTFMNSPGLWAQQGAMDDYNAVKQNVEGKGGENDQRMAVKQGMAGLIDSAGQKGAQYAEEINDVGEAGAQNIEDVANKNYKDFVKYQDENLAQTKAYLDEGIATAHEMTLASVSSGQSGMQAQTEAAITEQMNMLNAPGANKEAIMSQISMLKQNAAHATQANVSRLQDERVKLMSGVRMEAGRTYAAASGTATGQRHARMSAVEQATTTAAFLRKDAKLQSAQFDMQVSQFQMQGYNSLAAAVKNLPSQHVSIYDSIVAAGLGRNLGINQAHRTTGTFNGQQVTSSQGYGDFPNFGNMGGNFNGPNFNFPQGGGGFGGSTPPTSPNVVSANG